MATRISPMAAVMALLLASLVALSLAHDGHHHAPVEAPSPSYHGLASAPAASSGDHHHGHQAPARALVTIIVIVR